MIEATESMIKAHFDEYCQKVTTGCEVLIINRLEYPDVVMLSREQYNSLVTKANAASQAVGIDRLTELSIQHVQNISAPGCGIDLQP
ncbi:MAG: hypothetical protein WCG21_12120 [Eubacteriales bacterium]